MYDRDASFTYDVQREQKYKNVKWRTSLLIDYYDDEMSLINYLVTASC